MIDSDIHRKLHDYLCKFLNRIPDNDFNIIWDMLLFKTTMKTKQTLKELNRTERTYLYVQGSSFSTNDRHYRELLDVLYKYYKEKSTIKAQPPKSLKLENRVKKVYSNNGDEYVDNSRRI